MAIVKNALLRLGRKLAASLLDPLLQIHYVRLRAEIIACFNLQALNTSVVPWTTASLRPSILLAIYNDILINRRSTIVELGGGTSTIFIGRLCRQVQCHLYTIEDDADWFKDLTALVAREGLTGDVSVIHAPLEPVRVNATHPQWYSERCIENVFGGKKVDLLIVDGPGDGIRRGPAVSFFRPYLASDYAIIVDDLPRGVRAFLPSWEQELGISFRVLGDYAWASTRPEIRIFPSP